MLLGFNWKVAAALPFTRDYECNWDYLSLVLDSVRSWTNFLGIVEHFEGLLLSWEKHWGQPNVQPSLVDALKLEAQSSFFKVTMLANFVAKMKPPLDCNPCSRMWALLNINQIICSKLSKWLKLVELSMAMVLGSMENDKCFSNLSFMKRKLRN
jgi:hypothetical protein